MNQRSNAGGFKTEAMSWKELEHSVELRGASRKNLFLCERKILISADFKFQYEISASGRPRRQYH